MSDDYTNQAEQAVDEQEQEQQELQEDEPENNYGNGYADPAPEAPQEEVPQEEVPYEEPKDEAKEPIVKTDLPKSNKTSKSKQTNGAPAGDIPKDLNTDSAWKAISADPPSINWYLCGVDKKTELVFSRAGQQGLEEITTVLKSSGSELQYGLLRVNSNDKGGSKRAKFVYIRFVGTGVNVMQKAKVTPKLGKIGDAFPVKHLTYDLTEDLANFTIDTIAKEMLRVGGAHKPDSFDFGPNQEFVCK